MSSTRFMVRTVLVKDGKVESSLRLLNSILAREGVIDNYRRIQRYEKPWQTRRRVNFERMRAVYNEEMTRKINFLMRKNRPSAYPGCY